MLGEIPEDSESEDDEDDEEVEEDQLADFDSDFENMLRTNRLKRAAEEEARTYKLKQEHLEKQKDKQAALDKELAVIAARKKIEQAELERLADLAVVDSNKNAEELVFDFSFNF